MVPAGPDIVFTGRFGSGKTEIALNYAARIAAENRSDSPILIDLDLVTPYFRSREAVMAMRERGVHVIAPLALSQAVDVPAVTPEILGAIQQTIRPVILDVGGDEQGARALGQFSGALRARGYRMNFVVNPYRPQSATPDLICSSIQEIERSSRLVVSALVSNPNLMNETDVEIVKRGHAVVKEAARVLDLPIAFVVLSEPVLSLAADGWFSVEMLPVHRFFRLPWEDEQSSAVQKN